MRKKVEFIDTEEKVIALLDRRVFYVKDGESKIHFDNKYTNPFRAGDDVIHLWSDDWYEEIEPVWPKDFKPCWCWVSDDEEGEEKEKYRFIDIYDPEMDYPFIQPNSVAWYTATPMTAEEMLKFCWEEIVK